LRIISAPPSFGLVVAVEAFQLALSPVGRMFVRRHHALPEQRYPSAPDWLWIPQLRAAALPALGSASPESYRWLRFWDSLYARPAVADGTSPAHVDANGNPRDWKVQKKLAEPKGLWQVIFSLNSGQNL
jgi:hypothetical protein